MGTRMPMGTPPIIFVQYQASLVRPPLLQLKFSSEHVTWKSHQRFKIHGIANRKLGLEDNEVQFHGILFYYIEVVKKYNNRTFCGTLSTI